MTPSNDLHKQDILGRFANHKVAANLLMVVMLVVGFFALSKLNRQFLPNFALDYITVRVVWPGASAEDVARSVTTPLEQELRNLDNVKEMTSTSSRGLAVIVVQYKEGADMGLALNQVKERVGLVRNLPSDAEEPEISKVVRNEDIATLILTAQSSLEELRPLAHRFERQLLDRGVSKVEFIGLPDQEIAIEISSHMVETLGLSLPQIGQRIASQSQDIPAGTIGQSDSAREVRSLEKRRSPEAFSSLPVLTTADGKRLMLGDIATLSLRPKEQQVEVFYEGAPAILMQLKRPESSDALDSAKVMQDWLEDIAPTLPPNIHVFPMDERYNLIQQRIDLLVKNGIGGLILVVAILYVFLNGRVAFWVTMGIPVSFMGALAVLYFNGGTINMVSLFALIMTLGIIVDDAIVVAEDALTHYQTGEASLQAAEGGARRMFVPVMSSSLTTVAAFLPLMLVGGIIGNILADIPFVVVCVITASLLESFLILPGHLRHSFHKNHHRAPSPVRQKMDDAFNRFRDHSFRPVLQWVMQNRATTLLGACCAMLLAISLVKFGHIKFHFFPQPEGTMLIASAKFTAGTPPETVKNFAFLMERKLKETDAELRESDSLIQTSLVRLNTGSFDGGQRFQFGDQYATVQVELIQPDSRSVRNQAFIGQWRNAITLPAGLEQLSITSPQGGPPGRDIDIFLAGSDPETLKTAAGELADKLKEFAGVEDILDDLPYGKQQFIFSLTPLGQSLGLSISDVGQQVRAALDGQLLQIYQENDEEVEVRIMLPKSERQLQRTLETLPIVTSRGATVPLGDVIHIESRRGLDLLRHTDGRLGVHVTAEVDNSQTNANEVLDQLQAETIPQLITRYGVIVNYKGKAEEQKETGADMAQGALLALLMIYLILAWVFASYSWPLAVMIAIPFGLCGAVFGHWVMGIDLTLLSQFGMFGLSGIVINDSIILVTFYKELRAKGVAIKEALVDAACLRLRAVLLTSLTTIAGLLPLLFETSLQAQFLIPMAVSISFGLAFATLLVLIVIPVILSVIEQVGAWFAETYSTPQDAQTGNPTQK
ncbi:MAG: efflux RND transporter permease subunit [Hahellaceae bacterium]|nr:efflux RND transporter permease subunit [Hahellaceae bacterium]MCP5168709.1 efflux RND transporter permease subunit [Hahellaceae bacterium]